jgi:hypothetical protein
LACSDWRPAALFGRFCICLLSCRPANSTHTLLLLLRLFGSQYYLSFDESSLLPGLVFGVVIGLALHRRRLVSVSQIGIYASAATASHFAGYNLVTKLAGVAVLWMNGGDGILRLIWVGMVAGLLGATCLTVLSLPIFPFIRHWRPCPLMALAGLLLGSLLGVALRMGMYPFGLLILYGLWQAGYAAALGTAVPRRALRPDGPAGGL